MQEIKEQFKRLGEYFRKDHGDHQALLRQKLRAVQSDVPLVLQRRFSWIPFFGMSVAGLCFVVAAGDYFNRSVPVSSVLYEEPMVAVLDTSSPEFVGSPPENADLERIVTPSFVKSTDGEIVDYENTYGAMLEQSVSIRMLTKEDDASETVAALFASLGGRLTSIRDNEGYATITGAIPAARMSFFYDELEGLVKNDAFIEKTLRGDSITAEALDLADRLEALRTAEADVTAQLAAATTHAEKTRLQESLETISEEIASMLEEQGALEDRADFVTVSVSLQELPSLWNVESHYELREVIAGLDQPSLWQRVLINVLTFAFAVIEVVSMTFWILIPLGYVIFRFLWNRRRLRELD